MSKIKKRRNHTRTKKRVWQLQEAKARFSELVSEVEHGSGYQTVTKNGRPVVMIISKEEFEQMHAPENTLLDFFRESPLSETDLDLGRNDDLGRDVDL